MSARKRGNQQQDDAYRQRRGSMMQADRNITHLAVIAQVRDARQGAKYADAGYCDHSAEHCISPD